MAIKKFIGSGITFPLQIEKGSVVVKSDFSLIRSSIGIILNWQIGTRFYNERFGSRIWECLEEPNDNVVKALLSHFIIESLTLWEKRIELKNNSLIYTKVSHDKINITLTYRLKNSNIEETYIYPFYKEIIY